ncbi:hypothetical protein PAHAL_4G247800 [Panicum hallii]|uniref:Uncharacterized protein n=1 Tax=Panicum hallii TaxID=206008 RepID=A0A2T8JDW3_9POAL|nr:hypothetical protein PAHAL_4G247800 [Panicum hallii]
MQPHLHSPLPSLPRLGPQPLRRPNGGRAPSSPQATTSSDSDPTPSWLPPLRASPRRLPPPVARPRPRPRPPPPWLRPSRAKLLPSPPGGSLPRPPARAAPARGSERRSPAAARARGFCPQRRAELSRGRLRAAHARPA